MNIAISGASGFIGSYLSQCFQQQGYGVIPLPRELFNDSARLKEKLSDCDVIINLAGAPINHRWGTKYKRKMWNSRIETTELLVKALMGMSRKPALFISASAIGIYPSKGCHTEDSMQRGDGFLSNLCMAWETAAKSLNSEIRVVNPRFGIVFSRLGGAFPKMTLGARQGLLAIPGSGHQALSWIALEDLARAMVFLIEHPEIEGPVNFTAPQSLTYREFAKAVSVDLSGGCTVRIPAVMLQLGMGEAASVLLQGQCAPPDKLLQAGFVFLNSSLEEFLARHD